MKETTRHDLHAQVQEIQPARRQGAAMHSPVQKAISGSPQVGQLKALRNIANGPAVTQLHAAPQGGLPPQLKSGIEHLSGMAMNDVHVHFNSSKPAQLHAHAYAQGTDIHIAPGQERHLPHEAWHVVQQKQGRVKPTLQLKGVAINDESALEREADVMGDRAMGINLPLSAHLRTETGNAVHPVQRHTVNLQSTVFQRITIEGKEVKPPDALRILQSKKDEIETKFHDYISDVKFMRSILQELDTWAIPYDDMEKFIEAVTDNISRHVEHLFDEKQNQAPLAIQLPGLAIESKSGDDANETKRQIDGQVKGLNNMSAADWLRNVLLNRMKSLDTMADQKLGTKGGAVLGKFINNLLYTNDALAAFAMDAIIDKLNRLTVKYPEYASSPLIQNLYQSAVVAKASGKEIYVIFEKLGGPALMSELNLSGMEGGMGRQHGTGDEKWFRAEFKDGIELLKGMHPATLSQNAILHNPDQCIGGDMEVGADDLKDLQAARDMFRSQTKTMIALHHRLADISKTCQSVGDDLKNYEARLPSWQSLNRLMASFAIPSKQGLQERYDRCLKEVKDCEQQIAVGTAALATSASNYTNLLQPHVGNGEVNSLLGRQWMASDGKSDSRVLTMLKAVLEKPNEAWLASLEHRALEVTYPLQTPQQLSAPTPASQANFADAKLLGTISENFTFGQSAISDSKQEVLNQSSVSMTGKQQSLDAVWSQKKSAGLEALDTIKRYFQIGFASGRGMNCLIRAILKAAGKSDSDEQVMDIRTNAMALGLLGAEDMIDLHHGGGAAVLEQLRNIVDDHGYVLHVIQVNPMTGAILARDRITVGNGAVPLYIMHMGAHFSPLNLIDRNFEQYLTTAGVQTVSSNL